MATHSSAISSTGMLLVVMRMALQLDSHDMFVEVSEVNNHACDEC